MEKQIGAEAKLQASIQEGMIRLQIDQKGTMGGAGAYVYTTAEQLVQALCDLIPGDTAAEKAGAVMLEGLLKKISV